MTDFLLQWAIRLIGGISKEQWAAALKFVSQWATSQLSGDDKRAKVLEMLAHLGIEGSKANWLVETAVRWLKRTGVIV